MGKQIKGTSEHYPPPQVRKVRKPDHAGRGQGLPNGPPTLPWRHWEKPGRPEFASRKGGKILMVYEPLSL